MQLAVGYPLFADDLALPFVETVRRHREQVGEVYFAWPGDPSGRAPAGGRFGSADAEAQEQLETDLAELKAMGVRLDLLFNANCYGARAISQDLARHMRSTVERIAGSVGLDAITTTSPFVAAVLRESFPDLHLRASVNMRIGTVQGMDYLADLFDSFYVQRDYNRDMDRVRELHEWSRARGKSLCILVNSGCLAFCSGQTFHDNMVAHESEIAAAQNVACDVLACRRHLHDPANWPAVLAATWIRPEDLHHYEPYAAIAKLATRMHQRPELVVGAYAHRSFRGNLLDLLEPGHGDLLPGRFIDNAAFPPDWFARTTSCSRNCSRCDYCRRVLHTVLGPAEAP